MTTSMDPARTRRLGLSTAAIIAAYAVVVGAISAAASNLGPGVVSPPEAVPRPIVLALLLSIPAGIAAIGSMRGSRPVLIAAGILCLVQSFIAFSGVTIPFVIPALLLLVIGGNSAAGGASRRAAVGGALIVALGVAALIAPFVLTQTTCWVARRGADGSVIYTQTPATNTDSGSLGLDDLASGCGSGDLTVEGVGLAALLGIGAIALAAVAASRPSPLAVDPP
jgi:hypothetical protein